MKIDSYNSQKIKILSFWMIVMVVYIHSYYLEAESMALPNFVQRLGGSITSVAVPLFYAISGFLFFNGIQQVEQCWPKIKKRVSTLLVPYVIWNIIFVLWYVVLAYTPGVSAFVNSDMLSDLSLSHPIDTFNYLFIKPAGFQMWFLRDLILFVICSPLLYLLIKYTKWFAFIIVLCATGWMTRFWMTSFVLGGTLAICYNNGLDMFRNKRKQVFMACLVLYFTHCVLNAFGLLSADNEIADHYIGQVFMVVPMVAIWGGYDFTIKESYKPSKHFALILNFTFFLFLFHEPVFNIIKKLGVKAIGNGDIQLVILYLVNPGIMIAIAVAVGIVLKRVFPKIYSISVGGR